MAKLTIDNLISFDGGKEAHLETHEADYYSRAGKRYLVYLTEDGHKVVLKFDSESMQMTRFEQPPTRLDFHEGLSRAIIAGQTVDLRCLTYQMNEDQVSITYQLLQGQQLLATYRLQLSWTL